MDIKRGDRVLEVGSEANPCIRSNVLVDRWVEPKGRIGSLLIDRPFVFADALELPFSDKSFDYVQAYSFGGTFGESCAILVRASKGK